MELRLHRVYPEMSELIAKATKARKAIPIEAVAISVNSSFPQFDTQSSTRVAADDDADIRRYARTYTSICHKNVMIFNIKEKALGLALV